MQVSRKEEDSKIGMFEQRKGATLSPKDAQWQIGKRLLGRVRM